MHFPHKRSGKIFQSFANFIFSHHWCKQFFTKKGIIFALIYQIPSWICKFEVFKTNTRDGNGMLRFGPSRCWLLSWSRIWESVPWPCGVPMGNAFGVSYATWLDHNMGMEAFGCTRKSGKRERVFGQIYRIPWWTFICILTFGRDRRVIVFQVAHILIRLVKISSPTNHKNSHFNCNLADIQVCLK